MLATPPIAVQCTNVEKFYGKGDVRVQALRGTDLKVLQGELLMLVGPSGCGKTTLLSVIVGILDHDSGQVDVFGKSVDRMNASQKTHFRMANVGFAFQQFNLLPQLSAVENAALPLLIANWPRRKAFARSAELLDQMGMADRMYALPKELSGGQQQRVAFARAMIHDPRLIVADEPTSALDSKTGERVMTLLRQIAVRPDRAVIVVTHDARIFHHADRIAEMDDGRILAVHTRSDPTGPFAHTPPPLT